MKFVVAAVFCLSAFGSPAWPGSVPKLPLVRYSNPFWTEDGYRLGYIQNIDYEGIFVWTFEGAMTLGFGSAAGRVADLNCMQPDLEEAESITDTDRRSRVLARGQQRCYLYTNPWAFSFLNSTIYQEYKLTKFVPILLYYAKPLVSFWGLFTDTTNFIYGMYPVDPEAEIPKSYVIGGTPSPNVGYLEGHIVKATMDHSILKTYEVIIQRGVNGNNFVAMSVDDTGMFDYIVKAMYSGKVLRIGFLDLIGFEGYPLHLRGYDTYYRITSVELLDPPPAGLAAPVQ